LEESSPALSLGPLTVCPVTYMAHFDGRDLQLSGTEIEILSFLIENQGRVSSRSELAEAVDRRESTVDILITRLRQKVGRNFIRNVRGRGWIIDPKKLELRDRKSVV
jgi:DNA-binding response OmpR family regulator